MTDLDVVMTDWAPGRWYQVIAPDGALWVETSDREEAISAVRPGDTIRRIWVRTESEWREDLA